MYFWSFLPLLTLLLVVLTQIRTQNRIQEIVPNLRFLLFFKYVFAILRHKSISCDKRAHLSMLFVSSVDGLFLFSLKLWIFVKIAVII